MSAYEQYRQVNAGWIAQLPNHWEAIPVKYVCTYNDEVLSETADPEALIEYIEISDVDGSQGLKSSEVMPYKTAPSRARRIVKDGDVIISTVRTYLRAVAPIINPPENLVVSTGFAVIRPERLASGFARYALVAEGFVGSVISRSTGVSYPAINASDLVRIPIPVPPIDEQTAIAVYLDAETKRIDELIGEKKKLFKALTELKKSIVTEAITLGIDKTVTFVDSGLEWAKKIPAGWRVASLKRFVKLIGGHTPSTTNPSYWDGDVPWFSPKDMKSDELQDSIDHVTRSAVEESGLSVIESKTTMIVVRGMILAHSFPVCVTQVPGTLNQDMKALIPDETIEATYLPWLLRGAAPLFLSLTDQSGHGTLALRTDRFMSEALPIPPKNVQLTIINFIETERRKIDDLLAHVHSEISLLTEMRAATITDLVLGRIDVRKSHTH